MESTIKTKKCSNCKKELEETKIMLHEPYCMRTLKFCDICEDAIEISEYEEHSKSHKLKKTEIKKEELVAKPKQEINQNNLNINKSYEDSHDLKRFESIKINCEFCDLQVPDAEFYDHEAMCGARSTKCEYCDKNLLYQQLNNHLKDCNAKIIIEQNAFEDDYDGNEFFSFLIDDVALINKKMQMEEDEKLAQLLEQNTLVDVEKENEDLELAKRMQMELDERLAREYENENANYQNNTDNNNNNNFPPVNNEEDDMDENFKRILELSKHHK